MSLDADSILHKVDGQASRVTQGEALVVLAEQRELHRLNAVGTRVWELCDGRSVGAIVNAIVAEFEVDPPLAQADVLAFLEQLLGLGALRLQDAS
jgi:hypothetical protein